MAGLNDLTEVLVSRALGYRERLPVYRLSSVPIAHQIKRAVTLAGHLWDLRGDCDPRVTNVLGMARLLLPEDGHVNVYPSSGAIDAFRSTAASRPPLANDVTSADQKRIVARLRELSEAVKRHFVGRDEELRPETLWETKARGVTLRGEASRTALLEVVGAYRRYVHGIPVLGRASVHIAIGGAYELTKWGVDWRQRQEDAFTEAAVIDPEEGARRVMADVQNRRLEGPLTLTDFQPERMTLGYLSMPRRQQQSVLQPGWVAVFRARGQTTMGIVIAVPAVPAPYESIALPARVFGPIQPALAGRS